MTEGIQWGTEFGRIALYLGVPAIIAALWGMWSWERTCRQKTKVITIRMDGSNDSVLVPKEGGYVEIKNPSTGQVRAWPINELATIRLPYPDLGILPRFLSREIQTAIVHEGDIEPLLNRSPHRRRVVSPDVYDFLKLLAEETKDAESKDELVALLDEVSTGPSRELIADPATLGSLMTSTVMKALASVGDDLLDHLKQIRSQLARFSNLNSTYVYIGLGFIIVMQGFMIYTSLQSKSEAATPVNLEQIESRIGQVNSDLGIVIENQKKIMNKLGVTP
jgi:hypothetical protein